MSACPLCRGTDLPVVARTSAAELVRLYQRGLGLDVTQELVGVDLVELRECRGCNLASFAPAAAGSDRFYDEIQQFDWYYLASKPEFDVAASRLSDAKTLLELGCGRGAFAERLLPSVAYTGIELSSRAVCEARRRGLAVTRETVEHHAERNAGAYDAVVSFQVLEHVVDVHGFLEAAVRCLGRDGRLIISVPAADGFMGAIVNNPLNCPPHHLTWWTDGALRGVAEIFGLDLMELVPDEMAPQHLPVYARHLLSTAIGLGRRTELVDLRMRRRVADRLLTPLVGRVAACLSVPGLGPRGHSVTAVFRRR